MTDVPLYQREFGLDFRIPAEVQALVAEGLAEDLSYHHDACPKFGLRITNDVSLNLWVEDEYPKEREDPESCRFMVCRSDDGAANIVETDSMAEAIAEYKHRRLLVLALGLDS